MRSLSTFVKLAGFYNLFLGLGIATPYVTGVLGIEICDYALNLLIAVFLIFTAATQVIAARDLKTFAPIVFWEGLLRWSAAAILIFYGFFGHLGSAAGLLGLGDFLIGSVFVLYLPKAVGVTPRKLMTGLV